jgi:hypothetical protein
LINALRQFSQDYVNLTTLIIGGENEDWPTTGSRFRSGFTTEGEFSEYN